MSWRPKSRCAAAAEVLYDWAGGLIWVATPAADAAAAAVRAAVRTFGGHATLVRGSAALRAGLDVFEPQEAGLAALTKRVKESFDPSRVAQSGSHVGAGLTPQWRSGNDGAGMSRA